jgi:hypothetical protein
MKRPLVIAILAKNKEHILPTYLNCLLRQTAVDSNTIFYIRTNDNKDGTAELLKEWYLKWNWKYRMVFDDSSVDPKLIKYENHEWDSFRFKLLGEIRQKSIEFAISEGADYFIADADNLISPKTIENLRNTNLPVVAPLLHPFDDRSMYSNFHTEIDGNGYFAQDNFGLYNNLLYQQIKGLVDVKVVHCTYFIKNEILPHISYDDNSYRFEYVIFSDVLRKKNIPQYLDTREIYGRISFSVDQESYENELKNNPPYNQFVEYINKSTPKEWQIR